MQRIVCQTLCPLDFADFLAAGRQVVPVRFEVSSLQRIRGPLFGGEGAKAVCACERMKSVRQRVACPLVRLAATSVVDPYPLP